MSARPNSFKIGLFVIIGIGILVAALFAFGARSYFQRRKVFETYIPGVVQGLSAGSPVTLRGVPIGKVTFVGFVWNEYPQIKESYVLIRFEIPETGMLPLVTNLQEVLDFEVARGLRARVQGQGINPASDLALDYLDTNRNPALKISWTPGHYYIPSAPGQIGEILASIEKITRSLEKVSFPDLAARLDAALASVNGLVTNLDRVDFGNIGSNINSLATELRATNERLQASLAEAQGAIKGADLPAISRNTLALEARLGDVAGQLNRLLLGLDTANFNETLVNARDATGQLNDVLRELKQQPSRLLFSKPVPPSSSVEKPPRK